MWIWRSHFFQWMKLLALSSAISFVLFWFHLPAALLLGPMIAGISLSLRGAEIRVPRPFFIAAQAIIGCMIARSLTSSIFGVLLANWALVLLILFSTLAISALADGCWCATAIARRHGAWGSSPGGASAMVIMAQEYGADVRLDALMQYFARTFAAAPRRWWFALRSAAKPEMTQQVAWFPPISWQLPLTLLVTAAAGWLGLRLRFPSGAMLFPMLLGALVQGEGWLQLELPEWLLALAYAAVGWSVGLKFNKQIFLLALKTLPQILASIIGLILLCALMAYGLTQILPLDFMTAYLATSPGGLDTVAIIAAGTRADISFIMAMQTLRLFTILLTGPAIARFISRYAARQ